MTVVKSFTETPAATFMPGTFTDLTNETQLGVLNFLLQEIVERLNVVSTTAGTVDTADLTDEAVTALKLAAAAVEEAKIATAAVTSSKVGTDAITADKIAANAVVASKIQADAITAVKIQADAVIAAKIIAGAVVTAKIADAAVTTGKVADLAVATGKVSGNAISTRASGTAGSTTVASATWTDLLSVNHTSSGGDILIVWKANYTGDGADGALAKARLLEDGVQRDISEEGICCTGQANVHRALAGTILRAVGAATRAYKIQGFQDAGSNQTFNHITLMIWELKK